MTFTAYTNPTEYVFTEDNVPVHTFDAPSTPDAFEHLVAEGFSVLDYCDDDHTFLVK